MKKQKAIKEPEASEPVEQAELTIKQELFCKYYATDMECFANGTAAYILAYGIDTTEPGAYNVAKANASRLLTNANIYNRINELLEMSGLNDAFVDKQLTFLISQHDDFSAKINAIKEYNNLKSRITKNIDVKSDGKAINQLPTIIQVTHEPKPSAE